MATIFEIANHVLAKSPVGLSNRELQKILYIAQGFYLAQTGEELFGEDFAAWKYGPVHSGIFHLYKEYGYHSIVRPKAEELPLLPEKAATFIAGLVTAFCAVGQGKLIEYSHADVPWATKYVPDQNVQLTKSDLKDYFANFSSIEEYKVIANQKVEFHDLIAERLKYLRKLPEIGNAWVSGTAEAPSIQACALAGKFLEQFERFLFSRSAKPLIPKLVMGPIPRGGVSIEFHTKSATYFHFYNTALIEVELELNGEFSDREFSMEEFEENFSDFYEMVMA